MIPSYYAQQRILPENAPVGPLFLCISAIISDMTCFSPASVV